MLTLQEEKTSAMQKNQPSIINAWCSYDWANSVYSLTITSTIFPVYYSAVTRAAFGGEVVSFFGLTIMNTVLYSYAISFSFLLIALISPLLSGIADYSGRKKEFMKFFTFLGSFSCLGLYFFTGENIELGILFSVLASIGYAGALVFYNAFLPEIVTIDRMDKVSARGFSMGYIGSVILLLISLLMIQSFEGMGFESSTAPRVSFLLVGLWWIGFSQIAFYYLREPSKNQKIDSGLLLKGFYELRKVFKTIRKRGHMPKFLLSFFFYSMGVQTLILLAPLFGESVIELSKEKLILTVLLLQLVAIIGSYLFAFVAEKGGNKVAILIMLVIWMGICIGAYHLQTENQFFIMAAFLGVVLGGIQSISRSTYSKLIPTESDDSASYFSLYEVAEKLAIVIGTFSFGFILQLTEEMRYSALGMVLFFATGFLVLLFTRLPKGKEAAD